MKPLYDYILERLSDNEILFRVGVNYLNGAEWSKSKNYVKKYKINQQNIRPGVLRFAKDIFVPIIPQSQELIPRKQWNLDSLIGETEMQLLHPDYYKAQQAIVKNKKDAKDVCCIFQCSAKKPYYVNVNYRPLVKNFGDYCDFAAISNPGIIPFDYSACYPFRYDEWSIPNEMKLKDIIGMTHKYRIVNLCRFLKFKRDFGYKHILVYIPNKLKQWVFDEAIKHNIEGVADWCHIVINDTYRKTLSKEYPQLGGIVMSRASGFGTTYARFAKLLKKYTENPKEVEKIWKEYRKTLDLKESWEDPKYVMKDSLSYSDIISKFKAHIKDNMSDSSVDKGSNNLYYKSYYWTTLDLLLIGMDGDLVKDIDKEYWNLNDKLSHDSDWENFGEFLWVYKPLRKNDDVSLEKCKEEAKKLALIADKPELKIKNGLFK